MFEASKTVLFINCGSKIFAGAVVVGPGVREVTFPFLFLTTTSGPATACVPTDQQARRQDRSGRFGHDVTGGRHVEGPLQAVLSQG